MDMASGSGPQESKPSALATIMVMTSFVMVSDLNPEP